MAVRNDFTAGEVLAAADLNDTFASKLPYSYGTATPSTTDSGFFWYDSNSTPAAPKFWDGAAFQPVAGLTLITTETFSAVSSVSLNGCFTSTFDHYRMIMTWTQNTSQGNTTVRLRASGSDVATSTYDWQRNYQGSYTRSNSVTSWQVSEGGTGDPEANYIIAEIMRPALSEQTLWRSFANYSASGAIPLLLDTVASHQNATAYDGFSVITAAGTMTGSLSVYGFSK